MRVLAGRISSREGRRPITLTQGCGANGYSDDTAARRELGTRLQIGCVATASDDPEHQRRGEVSVNTHAHSFASTCTFAVHQVWYYDTLNWQKCPSTLTKEKPFCLPSLWGLPACGLCHWERVTWVRFGRTVWVLHWAKKQMVKNTCMGPLPGIWSVDTFSFCPRWDQSTCAQVWVTERPCGNSHADMPDERLMNVEDKQESHPGQTTARVLCTCWDVNNHLG